MHVRLTRSIGFFFLFPIELVRKKSQFAAIEEKSRVEMYLRALLQQKEILNHDRIHEFLQLGRYRFSTIYGPSLMEGWVKVRTSPMEIVEKNSFIAQCFGIRWSRKGRIQFILFMICIILIGALIILETQSSGLFHLMHLLRKGKEFHTFEEITMSIVAAGCCWFIILGILAILTSSSLRHYR